MVLFQRTLNIDLPEGRERRHGEIRIVPLRTFLNELWVGGIIGS